MRGHPAAAKLSAVVGDQLARARAGFDLLRAAVRKVTREDEYADGLLTCAEARVWRLESLLRELAGKPPEARRALRTRVEASFAQSLSDEDARGLADRMLAGLPRTK